VKKYTGGNGVGFFPQPPEGQGGKENRKVPPLLLDDAVGESKNKRREYQCPAEVGS
jgi:hypothetical protein